MLDSLALSDCRITQWQDSHMKKWNGSMYAIDISCIRWQSFKVYTPDYFNTYVIEYIGQDKRLGNFLIIKHWEYRFVYWHTETDKNVWDRLWKHEVLWSINTSGISTSEHLHIELWRNNNNINWNKLNWWELKVNPKSFDLRLQRWLVTDQEVNQLILEYIAQYEGMHLKSYYDINHYSIGYWTPSYKWEVITKKEADKRARKIIQNIRTKYELYDLNLAHQKAIVSYVYNIWSMNKKQQWLLNNGNYCALWNDYNKYIYITIDWEKQIAWWLVKRRQAERNLLCK